MGQIRGETKWGIMNDLNEGSRLERQIMQNYFIKGDHIIGSKIDMEWGASFSRAEEQRPNERYTDYQVKGVAPAPAVHDERHGRRRQQGTGVADQNNQPGHGREFAQAEPVGL